MQEPQVEEVENIAVEDPDDDGTDRSMSCDEEEEKHEVVLSHRVSKSPPNMKNSMPEQSLSHHVPRKDHHSPPSTSGVPFQATMSQTDWETEQKLAALGVTGAPKPNRMPARPWQSAEPFRQLRHPPPPPEPLPIREDTRQLSPVWHQGSSARHERYVSSYICTVLHLTLCPQSSTSGFQESWEAPRQTGTGTPPYVPDLPEDLAEDNPWVPPGGRDVPFNGDNTIHTENGNVHNENGDQQTPQFPSDRRPSESTGNIQDPTSPVSSRPLMRNGSSIRSPEESTPVWKSNAPIRTSLKDRLAKIKSRKREFEPENPSDEDRGKERKRQEDDVTPRLKRRQPKVAEAYRYVLRVPCHVPNTRSLTFSCVSRRW